MTAHRIIDAPAKTPELIVNGVRIAPEAIAAEAQHHPAQRPEEAWRAAAEALAIREALLQAARSRGLEATPERGEDGRVEDETDALIRALVEAEITLPEPDAASCRRYFDNNSSKLRRPDLYEAAHILLQADRLDRPTFERVRADACALATHLQLHPDHFGRLARERSDCASAGEDGRLGQLSPGQTTPDFEAALERLQDGEITAEPVETRYGFHIIRLDRKLEGGAPDFETVRPLIEDYLREASWRRAAVQLVSRILGETEIHGVELHGATSPLVQ